MNAPRAKKGEAAATETVLRGVDGFAAASPLRMTGDGWRVGVWQPGRPLRETNGVASRLPDPLPATGLVLHGDVGFAGEEGRGSGDGDRSAWRGWFRRCLAPTGDGWRAGVPWTRSIFYS